MNINLVCQGNSRRLKIPLSSSLTHAYLTSFFEVECFQNVFIL